MPPIITAVTPLRLTGDNCASGGANGGSGNDTACATYNDFRELLGRSDIDAVVVATGERWHPLIAAAAARAGKHMYCEKPLALSVAAFKPCAKR